MGKVTEAVKAGVRAFKGELLDDRHGVDGKEYLDNTPIAMPIDATKPESLEQTIVRLMHAQDLRDAADRSGFETEAEANDFEVGDDFEPTSEFELDESKGTGKFIVEIPIDQVPKELIAKAEAAKKAAAESKTAEGSVTK